MTTRNRKSIRPGEEKPGTEGLSGTIRDDGRDRKHEDRDRDTGGTAVDDDNDFPLDEGDEQNFFA